MGSVADLKGVTVEQAEQAKAILTEQFKIKSRRCSILPSLMWVFPKGEEGAAKLREAGAKLKEAGIECFMQGTDFAVQDRPTLQVRIKRY